MKVRIRSLSGCSYTVIPSAVSITGCATCCWASLIRLLCLRQGAARQSAVSGVQALDLPPQRREITFIDDDVVSDRQARRARDLCGQHGLRLGQRHTVADLNAPQLQLRRTVHDQYSINTGLQVLLDQKRYRQYLINAARRLRAPLQLRPDGGVQEALECRTI